MPLESWGSHCMRFLNPSFISSSSLSSLYSCLADAPELTSGFRIDRGALLGGKIENRVLAMWTARTKKSAHVEAMSSDVVLFSTAVIHGVETGIKPSEMIGVNQVRRTQVLNLLYRGL